MSRVRAGVMDEVVTRSGMSLHVVDEQLQQHLDAFAQKINSDVNFRQQAVAAVLSNPETKAAFLGALSYEAQTSYPELKGLVIKCCGNASTGAIPYQYSYYTGRSAADQLSGLSVKGNQASTTPGQMALLSYNGSEWSGFLVEAAPYLTYLAPGCLVTPLVQALFGTKAGALMLPALLLLLL